VAGFVLLCDEDPARRARFLEVAASRTAPVPGLVSGTAAWGEFALSWAAAPGMPVDRWEEGGAGCVLFGRPVDERGRGLDARALAALRRDRPAHVLDGYFAEIGWDPATGLRVSVDLLGLYPVHWCALDGALLVGTSPEPFRHHPLFRPSLDPEALAGLLTTNGLVDGRALWAGVRRLAAGAALRAPPGAAAREEREFRWNPGTRLHACTFDEHLEAADAALDEAVAHEFRPGVSNVLMLSGGLDSRTVAGYMAEKEIPFAARTRGLDTDFEVLAARRVARRLGVPWTSGEGTPSLEEFERRVRFEHLGTGIGGGHRGHEGFEGPVEDVWSGIAVDELLSGYGFDFGRRRETGECSAERFLEQVGAWALRPGDVGALLTPCGGRDLVERVWARVRRVYEDAPGTPWQQAFQSKLATRSRHHLAGAVWSYALLGRPAVLGTHRRLAETAIDARPEFLLDRRLAKELLRRRFPDLARIPLDTASWAFEPLLTSPWRRAGRRLSRLLVPKSIRRRRRRRFQSIERRRVYRTHDFDDERWRAIRRRVEPLRDRVSPWMDPSALSVLLPPPDVAVGKGDPGTSGGRRLLCAFLLWAEDHT
jgi:asparagine synthase (glutamine-hydrolysing)